MISKKLLIVVGSLAILLGSAVGFRVITGQCPVGALMHKLHGGGGCCSQTTTTAVQP
jgi:hypothetical protein